MPVREDYVVDVRVHLESGSPLAVNLCADADRCYGCHTTAVELDGNSVGVLGSGEGGLGERVCMVCLDVMSLCGGKHGVFEDIWGVLSVAWSSMRLKVGNAGYGGGGWFCSVLFERFFATEEGVLCFVKGLIVGEHAEVFSGQELEVFAASLFSFLQSERESGVVRPSRRGLVGVIRGCGVEKAFGLR